MPMNFNSLKSLVQSYLPKLKSFIKFYVTLYFKLHIRSVHFFSRTYLGFGFYLFCFFYGFFGCHGTNCNLSNFLAGYFALLMISLSAEIFFLVKVPITRKWIGQLVGEDYIIKYLGKFSGSVSLFKYLTPVFAITTSEILTHTAENVNNKYLSDQVLNEYWKNVEKSGLPHDPNSKKYAEATKRSFDILNKPVHGIFTRTVMGENVKDNVKNVLSTINDLFNNKK